MQKEITLDFKNGESLVFFAIASCCKKIREKRQFFRPTVGENRRKL
jgi:hypothetical protein